MIKYTLSDLGEQTTPEIMKEHLLKMLLNFDQFCKENGLTYYLSGGTLLGAIRHKGFIPWDDDVDVNMPRPDCEKLSELTGGKLAEYEIIPPNYSDYRHAYHYKMYDASILVRKGERDNPYPIFMDIFPIEGLPDTKKKNIKHYRKIKKWKYLSQMLWRKNLYKGKNPLKKFVHLMAHTIAKCYGKKRLFNKVVGIMKSIPFEDSEYVGVMATYVHTTEERVKKSEYCKRIDVDFEGYKLSAPAGYDTYLRQLYGDHYMELPPVESRVSHNLTPYYADVKEPGNSCRIAICGLIKSANLGEMYIARSLEYLIEKELRARGMNQEIYFLETDILGRNDETFKVTGNIKEKIVNYYGFRPSHIYLEWFYNKIGAKARNIKSKFIRNSIFRFRHFIYMHCANYKKRLDKYYNKKMSDADFIVVDGAGLLEYSYNEYQEPLNVISKFAEKRGLSVVYNAIGRAGAFDEKDFRSTILKEALRSDAVKYVSARDSLETVQKCAGVKHQVKLLADAAFWLKELYKPEKKERKKIGIGLIRGNSLTGYGSKFGTDSWVMLFVSIARLLEKRGYEYEFFTNGLPGDEVLGRKILCRMNLPEEKLMIPENEIVLYDRINGYAGIITCRMHSAIAAFTLGVPAVILSWNDKVEKLMEIIGYEKRAIKYEQLDAEYIVDAFEKALQEGVDLEKVEVMKAKAKESVDDYIDLMYAELIKRKNEEIEISKSLRIS